MNFHQNVKLPSVLVILVLLYIIYIIYNSINRLDTVYLTILSSSGELTSDVLKLPHNSNTRITGNKTIFDLDIRYLLTSVPCYNSTNVIIIVTSYFGNVEARSSMRRAFNTDELTSMNVRRIFLLGDAPTDHFTTQKSIADESDRFNDILQGNFIEAYRNLTYKHMMGLKWAADNCINAKFIVKMDDDIVIDLRKVVHFLKNFKLPHKKLLAGYVLRNLTPKRDKANKWYVSYDEYRADQYPTFLSGWFYITNPRTAKLLILTSKFYKYFWIDDALITGVLARYLQITHYNLEKYFSLHSEFMHCCMNDLVRYRLDCPFLVGPNGGDNNLFFEFNKIMSRCSTHSCEIRNKSIDQTCVAERKINFAHKESGIIEKYKLF